MMDKISLVIPCYNEQDTLPFLEKEIEKVIDKFDKVDFEVILIDNCSEDNTLKLMKDLHKKNTMYKYISFSRNFGKDASILAGLKASSGDYVAVMDADLQDPPELLIEMYNILKSEDYDCVATYRKDRKNEPFLRSVLAKMFYSLMNKISSYQIVNGARDYRLMSRQMVNSILRLEESERFTKGIFSWVGFKTKWLPFGNRERVAGKTKLPMKSAFSYAIKGITSFSTLPLVMASYIGIIFCVISAIYMIYIIISHIFDHKIVSGYSSMMCVMLFGFGMILLVLGIIGEYLSQMYLEIKHRPKYIVKDSSDKKYYDL